ncbi:MAG: 1-phosphofructokinase family hexose kinase [Proteobacteria bacterium]|nr:1-phosphofructokinase family hexose kinase [Pseudomonadota bacterium]
MPARAVVTLTMNPAVDASTTVDQVVPFHKLRCTPARRDAGGGGINVARVLKRLNQDASAIFTAGGALGLLLRQLVAREDVNGIAIDIAGDTREDFSAFEKDTGKQFRFVLPGPSVNESEQAACLSALQRALPAAQFLVASGSLPPGVASDFYARVARAAKKAETKFILDTAGPALKDALKEGAYLIKPSLREFRQLVGGDVEETGACVKAARALIEKKGAEIVLLSLGERGAIAVSRDAAYRAEAPKVTAVSTVGAGDSFLGAAVASLVEGKSLQETLRHGVAAGTAALLSPGTDLCRPEHIARLIGDVVVEKV